MLNVILTALSLVATLSVAAPAFAQSAPGDAPAAPGYGPAPGAASSGHGYGRGGGRPVTLAEFQGRYRERLMRADTDNDSRISQAEFMAARAAQSGGEGRGGDPARQFQMLDANHDGFVTPAEIDAVSAIRFARMDANHDGVLTPDERMAARGGEDAPGGAVQPLPPPQ